MPRNTVYLEAPDLSQDLLNIKWALRSVGYAIGSTWHEDKAGTSASRYADHWNARGMEQLRFVIRWLSCAEKTTGSYPICRLS